MKPDKVLLFLKAMGVTNGTASKRAGNVLSRCPLGPWNHTNGVSSPEVFGVKLEQGDPRCNCFACDYKGTLGKLLQTMKGLQATDPRDVQLDFKTAVAIVDEAIDTAVYDMDAIPGIEERLEANRNRYHEFPQDWLDTFPKAWDVKFSRAYLFKRGVTQALAAKLDLRVDPMESRVCFPVRGVNGKLYGLHGRATLPSTEPRYRMYQHDKRTNPILWLGEHWVDTDKPIVVVEGPFDLASVMRVYPNVVSPLFANPSYEKLKRMGDALEWVTLLDHGTGGDKGREKIDDVMSKDRIIRHLRPPPHRKDPGECTKLELVDLLSPFVQLTTNKPLT
jgi:DNA primase